MSCHGRIRTALNTSTLERVYVWEMPVRLTHWVLFFSILILSATGYLHRSIRSLASRAGERSFRDGDGARHSSSMLRSFSPGGLHPHLLVVRRQSICAAARIHPAVAPAAEQSLENVVVLFASSGADLSDYAGHDAFAGSAYALFFLLYLCLIASGLALYTVIVAIGFAV